MRTLLLAGLLLLNIAGKVADTTYQVTGWRYIDSVTVARIEFPFNRWLVMMCDGAHQGDTEYLLHHGCVLTSQSASRVFEAPDMPYVNRKDEGRIEQSLNIQTLCNK